MIATESTLAPAHPDLPTPKFCIGDRVWSPSTVSTAKRWSCPDCEGTGKWKAVTPAGVEHELSCPRCGSHQYQFDKIPSLSYQAYEGVVRALTVSGIEVNAGSAAWRPEDAISYRCQETWSQGGGSTYYEKNLFTSEEEAKAEADRLAADQNATIQERPEVIAARNFASLRLTEAVLERADKAIWDSWWAYRHLADDVQGWAEDASTPEDWQSTFKWASEFSRNYHGRQLNVERLLAAVEDGDLDAARQAKSDIEALLATAREEHQAAKEAA